MMIPVAGWVAPFGDPGINDRSHLPRAFRSVPRPSSPLSAKASTRCPSFALDHKRRPPRWDDPRITRKPRRLPENRRAQGQAPPSLDRGATPPAAARMKTLLRTMPGAPAHAYRTTAPLDNSPCPRPVRLGHIHKSVSPFNQHQPRTPGAGAGPSPPGDPARNQTLVFTKPGLHQTLVFSEHRLQQSNHPAQGPSRRSDL
jgi:hypothetical protein